MPVYAVRVCAFLLMCMYCLDHVCLYDRVCPVYELMWVFNHVNAKLVFAVDKSAVSTIGCSSLCMKNDGADQKPVVSIWHGQAA